MRRAVIDIGTNSIKLLVAEVAGPEVQPILEESRQTRLGQGFYQAHTLQPGPIARTAAAVAELAGLARAQRAQSIRVIATSAARDAANSKSLTDAVEQAAGLRVEIISGDLEAELAFRGATTDPALAQAPLLLLDVGGGSTEFILGHGSHKDFQESFPMGTVRLLEKLPPSDPPRPEELTGCRARLREFLEKRVAPKLRAMIDREAAIGSRTGGVLQCVGTGGTASILGCMEAELRAFDRERIEATRLSLQRLNWHLERLWSMPTAERKQIVGLPANRADVILTGVAIYASVLERFGFSELRLSTRGLRFAAVMEGSEARRQ